MTVGFIGLGNIGTTLANLIANNGHRVIGWEYNKDVVEQINTVHENSKYLPGIKLNHNLSATTNLSLVMQKSEIIINAIPSVFIKKTLEPVKKLVSPQTIIVNISKGLDNNGITACGILDQLFPNNNVIMIAGPAIANEIARGEPTIVQIGGAEIKTLMKVANILDNNYLRVRFSDDRIGLELGGILKNIYAIGQGIMIGENITSINFRAVYLTLAIEEMSKIGIALGAKAQTFLSLAGIGDLIATSISENSHNRRLGMLLSQGKNLDEIKHIMGVLPEGFNTLKNVLYIAEKLHVEIPIAQNIWNVIQERIDTHTFVTLITRNFILNRY